MSTIPTARVSGILVPASDYAVPAALGSDRLRRPGLLSLASADLLVTLAALLAADHFRFTLGWGATLGPMETFVTTPVMALFGLVWVCTAFQMGLYDRPRVWKWASSFRAAVTAGFVADSILAAVLYMSYRDLSRLLFLYFVAAHAIGLVAVRCAFMAAERSSGQPFCGGERVVLIGTGTHVERVERALEQEAAGTKIVARLAGPDRLSNDSTVFMKQLSDVINETDVDEVVIADPGLPREELLRWVLELRRQPVHISVVPDFAELITSQASFEAVAGIPLIGLHEPAIRGSQWVVKRGFDIVVSLILMALAAPLFAVIPLAIWLESRGPVLFSQDRIGLGGSRFRMVKFRTMVVGAEARSADVATRSAEGKLIHKKPNDPRVTKVGRVLRRVGLDELPQLVHVLSGKMSLVGPRPELPEIVAEYEPWQFRRFAVAPGITGWWQVNRDHGVPMHLQTELDVFYLINYSLVLDLKILVRTFAVLIGGRGSY